MEIEDFYKKCMENYETYSFSSPNQLIKMNRAASGNIFLVSKDVITIRYNLKETQKKKRKILIERGTIRE